MFEFFAIALADPVVANGQTRSSEGFLLSQSQCQTPRSGKIHRVRLGDTLWGIAIRHGLNLNEILCLNPALRANPNLILVGQKINLGGTTSVRKVPQNLRPQNQNTYSRPRQVFSTKKPVTQPTPNNVRPKQPSATPSTSQPIVSTWNFNLPDRIRKGSRRMGATRGGPACYVNKNDTARALIPENSFGYTLQDYPTLYWYQPELNRGSVPVEFKLLKPRANNPEIWETIYQKEFSNSDAGIVSFTLPPDAPSLEVGQEYTWQIKIGCKPRVATIFSGNIKRLSANNPKLETKLANASIEDYPLIYAEAGIWYDTLTIMAGLLEKNPNDSRLIENWSAILDKIGYEDLSSMTFVNSRR